jgi:uncharacterized protein YihD (DUF1040 family)
MRDPQRIDEILKRLGDIWKENPDLRLGQLISNVIHDTNNLFYIEDLVLTDLIEMYYNSLKKNK